MRTSYLFLSLQLYNIVLGGDFMLSSNIVVYFNEKRGSFRRKFPHALINSVYQHTFICIHTFPPPYHEGIYSTSSKQALHLSIMWQKWCVSVISLHESRIKSTFWSRSSHVNGNKGKEPQDFQEVLTRAGPQLAEVLVCPPCQPYWFLCHSSDSSNTFQIPVICICCSLRYIVVSSFVHLASFSTCLFAENLVPDYP